MCGPYRRKSDKQRIAKAFSVRAGLEEIYLNHEDDIAPGSMQPVVSINETSKFWKDSFQERRCIIPADAIFEWQQAEKGRKKPKYEIVVPRQEPFGMAGLWKLWKNPQTAQWERTFAVITGDPNELIAPIHDRMTTFVEPHDYDEYLARAERPPVHLLRILPAEKMRATLVDATPITNQQVSLFDSQ